MSLLTPYFPVLDPVLGSYHQVKNSCCHWESGLDMILVLFLAALRAPAHQSHAQIQYQRHVDTQRCLSHDLAARVLNGSLHWNPGVVVSSSERNAKFY